jgi:nucleoside-diphosphate-sugar epimerase
MRIFVTGATGFIGAHFVESALEAGHSVVGLYRSETPRQQPLIEQLRGRGAVLHRGDILQPSSFSEAMQGAECVCHFAAAFRESGADGAFFERMNVEGTVNVLQAAAAAGIRRFVYCSTAGIHGQRVHGIIDERTAVRPWNSYERSKVAAEEQVRERTRAAGMEYVILRPTSVYGPRDERLLKLFRSVAKGRFPLFGKGEGRRHMIYVADLADAFVRACTVAAAANQAFIISGPEAVPLRELLSTLARVSNRRSFGPKLPLKPMMWLAAITEDVCSRLKVKPPIYRRRMDFYLNDAVFSSGRAQAVLGWKPNVGLAEGLAATRRAILGTPKTDADATRVTTISRASQMSAGTARNLRLLVIGLMSGALAAAALIDAI